MNKLVVCREKLDEIDSKIIELFEKRMEIIKEVALYKIENSIPVFDSSREEMMIKENTNKIQNEQYKKYYRDVLEGYLKASKDYQTDIIAEKNNIK